MFLLAALTLAFVLAISLFRRSERRRAYPPGPPGYPLIGNLLDIPKDKEWITYKDWSDSYSEPVNPSYYSANGFADSGLVHVSVFGTHIIIVNDAIVARELFDRRSSIYSDRPPLNALSELLEGDFMIALMRYGNVWREHRKASHHYFHPNAVQQYQEKQVESARHFLVNLLRSPEDFANHAQLAAGRLIVDVAYGVEVNDVKDPYITNAELYMKGVTFTGSSRGRMHDYMPFLSKIPTWAPGGGFNKYVLQFVQYGRDLLNVPFDKVKSDLCNSRENHSIAATFISQNENAGENEINLIKNTLASMYVGGSDTIVSTFQNFFRVMALFPDPQNQAQKEIDAVTLGQRLPTFDDMPSMPYTTALCSELLRWQPATSFGVPHLLLKEDRFNGYTMPKDSIVLGNIWAMLHEEDYPDPSDFRPERYLGPDPNPDPEFAFGFGRRMCPGRYFARDTLWITVAYILACVDISKSKDKDGVEIEIGLDQTSGFIHHPLPFQCSIKPRNDAVVSIINDL